MFIPGEALIGVIVYVSTAIATLRAGSRLKYILQHNDIGVMDGPLILGPTEDGFASNSIDSSSNKTTTHQDPVSSLWKYSYAFQQAVQLSLDHHTNQSPLKEWNMTLLDSSRGYNYKSRFDDSTLKKDLLKRGLRLRLLNELLLQRNDDEKIKANNNDRVSFQRKYNKWYHFWIDPIILGVLKWTALPNTSKIKPVFGRLHWSNHRNEKKWDYDQSIESLISLPNDSKTMARIRAYSPNIFDDLRSRFGVHHGSFIRSIFSSGPFVSFQSNSKGASRSGGFFFFTRDGMFMIKTIKSTEMQSLQKMLPKYHKYMMRNSKKSLLTRFCGLYGVQLMNTEERKSKQIIKEQENEQYFLIMNSVFPVLGNKFITERFDIKGSTVGRSCSQDEIETKKSLAVYKDLDLLSEREHYRVNKGHHHWKTGIEFGERIKSLLLDQLRHDVGLLISCDVMDYSLLMGVTLLNDDPAEPSDYTLFNLANPSFTTDTLRVITSPLLYIGSKMYTAGEKLISSVLTFPFPFYGADLCGVDCGKLSRIEGRRKGQRAVYYLGLIDFLQPWTFQKVIEREMKGLVGYNKQLISCVHPRVYATRFLDFIDSNIC